MAWEFIILIIALFAGGYGIYKMAEKFSKEGNTEAIENIGKYLGVGVQVLDIGKILLKVIDKDPTTMNPFEKIVYWAYLAVNSVYQEFGSVKDYFAEHEELSIEDIREKLKNKALEDVKNFAQTNGVELSATDIATASSIIEVFVLILKLTIEKN